MLVEVHLQLLNLLHRLSRLGFRYSRTSEITELVEVWPRQQDILHLEITMHERRISSVHPAHPLHYIREDLQDLLLRQAILKPRVHEIDNTSTRTVLHQNEDFVACCAGNDRCGGFYQIDYVLVASQQFLGGPESACFFTVELLAIRAP